MPATVLMPDDAGYDDARADVQRHARQASGGDRPVPLDAEDVAAAVRAARAAGLPIARSRRRAQRRRPLRRRRRARRRPALHARGRRSTRSGGSPGRRAALSGSTSTRATVAHGLATTGGTFVDTGIAGLTLTGGIGYLMGTGGFTCDNARRRRGRHRRRRGRRGPATDGDPELLWALRGGGGNFGVVTAFEYCLQPLGELQLGRIVVPIAPRSAQALEAAAALRPRHARRAQHVRRRPGARHAAGSTSRIRRPTARRRDQLRLPGIGGRRRGGDRVAARPLRALPASRAASGRSPTPRSSHGPASCRSACATTGRATSCASSTTARSTRGRHDGRGHAARPLVPAARGDHAAAARREPEGGAAFGQRGRAGTRRALGDLGGPRGRRRRTSPGCDGPPMG